MATDGRPQKRPWRGAFVPLLILCAATEIETFAIGRRTKNCLTDGNDFASLKLFLSEPKATTDANQPKPHRKRQIRRKTVQRRPRFYWLDPINLRRELRQFWRNAGLETDSLTIPNEVLLMHYQRHDLRAAISKHGGREAVSELLGGAPIMPGRWSEAVTDSPELRQLLQIEGSSLLSHRPPRVITSGAVEPATTDNKRWSHHDGRKPKGYWSLQTVIAEL
jgi:hypothetical protein